jgi:hypothetical protein
MKAINNYVNGVVKDAKLVLPAIKDAIPKLVSNYNEKTHPKLRALDNLILLCIVSFVLQLVYAIVVGTKEPFNAMLAGCFCSLGQFALSSKFFYSFLTFLHFSIFENPIE